MRDTILTSVTIRETSLEGLCDLGWDASDNRDHVADLIGQDGWVRLMSCLTKRQRQVSEKLAEGYTRRETAELLGISLMAVHRMVLRMRLRLAPYLKDGALP